MSHGFPICTVGCQSEVRLRGLWWERGVDPAPAALVTVPCDLPSLLQVIFPGTKASQVFSKSSQPAACGPLELALLHYWGLCEEGGCQSQPAVSGKRGQGSKSS